MDSASKFERLSSIMEGVGISHKSFLLVVSHLPHLQEAKIPIPNLDFGGAVLSPILPHASGFQILTTPITAIGIGVTTCPLLLL